eukprot:15700061-Heterocapsa_arctica.AAC.1
MVVVLVVMVMLMNVRNRAVGLSRARACCGLGQPFSQCALRALLGFCEQGRPAAAAVCAAAHKSVLLRFFVSRSSCAPATS